MRLHSALTLVSLCCFALPAYAQECVHEICTEGEPLTGACDVQTTDCVTDVCRADGYCCNGWWDNACVEMVSTVCGLNVCIAACAHSPCVTGEPLAANCNECARKVCKADPICCESQWDATCVRLVETTCANTFCQEGGGRCEDAVELDYYGPGVRLIGTLADKPHSGCTSQGSSCNNRAAWFSYTVPYGTDALRRVNTCGSQYSFGVDTVLSIHRGCPGDLSTEVLANDDWKLSTADPFACLYNRPERLLDSALVVPYNIPGGATYKIRVSHYNGSPATDYELFVPEPAAGWLRVAGLATLFALARWRQRRRGGFARG